MISGGCEVQSLDDLRLKAREALLEGAQSGKLMEVLEQPSPPAPAKSEDSTEEVERLRLQAREALLAGAESGKLMEVGDQVKKTNWIREKESEGKKRPHFRGFWSAFPSPKGFEELVSGAGPGRLGPRAAADAGAGCAAAGCALREAPGSATRGQQPEEVRERGHAAVGGL